MRETARHRAAFDIYYNMGPRRNLRAAAELSNFSRESIRKWAREFDWAAKVRAREAADAKNLTQAVVPVTSDDPVIMHLTDLMEKIDRTLETCFELDPEGKPVPTFTVKTTGEFVKLVNAKADLIMAAREVQKSGRVGKKAPVEKLADKINVFMGGLNGEDKLAFLKGAEIDVDARGIGGGQGRIQDADYTDVPDEGAEDAD